MLKILDWYILKKFITTFVFAILLLTFITVVIDISEKSDDFLKSDATLRQIVTEYYFGFIPHIVSQLFPLFVFISVIFFTSKMAGRSEIIAILASGTSYTRFLRPYWIGAIFLALVLWLSFRYVTPVANRMRTVFETTYLDDKAVNNTSKSPTVYFRNDTTHYGQVSYYDSANKRGNSFVLQHIVDGKLKENLRAETLQWDTLKKGWMLQEVIRHRFDSGKETVEKIASLPIALNFKPSEFIKSEYTKTVMKTPELDRFITQEQLRGSEGINEFLVERYHRDATPASLIILTMIGVAVGSRKVRGGSGLHIAIGFITGSLYILIDRFSTIFSTKGNLPPLLAAWTPNIIFLVVAIILFKRAPK
ncbi:MAG: YjgP/YjgQ family permease [Bacteroidetes bacterium]|nr:MAG: YjgP/YjgQ family permease [Bacteroidota bacterium]